MLYNIREMTEHKIILPDGRELGYAIYGDSSGIPVLYFHGTPSSRLEINLLEGYNINIEQELLDSGLQLIAVDRPGMGRSSYHPQRTFITFANDVIVLMQALNISGCSVICWSGGGPYALAIAHEYPFMIKNVFILCGFTRRFTSEVIRQMGRNKWYFLSAKYVPWLLEFTLKRVRNIILRRSLPQWVSGLPDADYVFIKDPKNLYMMSKYTLKEACRNGAKGAVTDARMYFDDFGFRLSAIAQPVQFWWGTEDNAIIEYHPKALEHQLPNKVLHYKVGQGHLSVYINCFREVLQAVLKANE